MTAENDVQQDPEINAISNVYSTLKLLSPDAQLRVLKYVSDKLSIQVNSASHAPQEQEPRDADRVPASHRTNVGSNSGGEYEGEDSDGISPLGERWVKRNGLNVSDLSSIFSIGGEEIDLVVKKVPGESKSKRLRSVFLLKGIAAYLGSGATRFSHSDAKETCLHYDAWDAGNFAHILKSIAAEVSGSKETGYLLTARGLAGAGELVKQLLNKAE